MKKDKNYLQYQNMSTIFDKKLSKIDNYQLLLL